MTAPEAPAPHPVIAEAQRLGMVLDQAFAAFVEGAEIDLAGLDDEVGRLCQKAASAEPEAREPVAEEMRRVFARLDRISAELLNRQALAGAASDAERSARARAAHLAYQRRHDGWIGE